MNEIETNERINSEDMRNLVEQLEEIKQMHENEIIYLN